MRPPLDLLIVSSNLENRRTLLNIMQGLPINTYSACSIEQAWELLSWKSADIIFCDERLSDGNYRELLSAVRSEHKAGSFVVLLGSDEWEDYLRALRLGASEAIRGHYEPTDIEFALIRTSRELSVGHTLHVTA